MHVLGLMSGTSMDGVDAAVLVTDGETDRRLRPAPFPPLHATASGRCCARRAGRGPRRSPTATARPGVAGRGRADRHRGPRRGGRGACARENPGPADRPRRLPRPDRLPRARARADGADRRRRGAGAAARRAGGLRPARRRRRGRRRGRAAGAGLSSGAGARAPGSPGTVVVVNIGGVANLTRDRRRRLAGRRRHRAGQRAHRRFRAHAHRRGDGPRRRARRARARWTRRALAPTPRQSVVRPADAEVARPRCVLARCRSPSCRPRTARRRSPPSLLARS